MISIGKGWDIFAASALLLWRNRAFALRVCLPLFGVIFAVDAAVRLQVFGHLGVEILELTPSDPEVDLARMSPLQMIATYGSWVVCLITLAVLWHRHVLGGQKGQELRPLGAGTFLHYGGNLAGLWVSITVGGILFVLFLLPFSAALDTNNFLMVSEIDFISLLIGLGLGLGYVLMRLSLILPAAAVGASADIGTSWKATRPIAGALWVVAALEFATLTLPGFAGDALSGLHGGIAWLVSSLLYAGALMLGLSILTHLYGELREDL